MEFVGKHRWNIFLLNDRKKFIDFKMPNYRILSANTLLDILSLSADATAISTIGDIIIELASNVMLTYQGKGQEITGLPLYNGLLELRA